MKSRNYTVTIDIDVWDARTLIQAARAKAREDGSPLRNCTTREALQWLLDPGVSPPGNDINDSCVDETRFGESR